MRYSGLGLAAIMGQKGVRSLLSRFGSGALAIGFALAHLVEEQVVDP